MKKFTLLALFCLCIHSSYAQQRKYNQTTLTASGGVSLSQNGYNISIGVDQYFKSSPSAININMMFGQNKQDLQNISIKGNLIYGNFNYLHNIVTLGKVANLKVAAGLIIGCEDFTTPNNYIDVKTSKFALGVNIAPQIEFLVGKKFILYVEPKYNYMIKTNIKNNVFIINGGFKINL